MARLLVGLTGGLASGKSTVARRLSAAGFLVLDADRLIAELHRPGQPGARAVSELLGAEYLRADGATDTAAVAARIFSDGAARAELEAVLHPLVRDRFLAAAARTDDVAILEATKLVEAGLAADFDLVVTVEAAAKTRIRRAVERGLDADEAGRRIAAQTGAADRIAAADRVLDNDGSLEDLYRSTDALIVYLRQLADRVAQTSGSSSSPPAP